MGEVSRMLCSYISQKQARKTENRVLNAPLGRILSGHSQLLRTWDNICLLRGVQVPQLHKNSTSHLIIDIREPNDRIQSARTAVVLHWNTAWGWTQIHHISLSTKNQFLLHRVTVWKGMWARAHQQLRGSENGWGHCWEDLCISALAMQKKKDVVFDKTATMQVCSGMTQHRSG